MHTKQFEVIPELVDQLATKVEEYLTTVAHVDPDKIKLGGAPPIRYALPPAARTYKDPGGKANVGESKMMTPQAVSRRRQAAAKKAAEERARRSGSD